MKKKQLLQLARLASQFLSAHLMYLVDVPWKSLKTKKTFVLTCELLLRLVQTTQFLSTLISLGKSAKLMPFQMVKMYSFLVSWSISNVLVSTQVTQWLFTHHKPCRKRFRRPSQTTPNA
ncbi:Uncharacterised protein [Streptococcus pneumoniae]|nr:Uncharacterised protein [Streptococcus pneumoniae]